MDSLARRLGAVDLGALGGGLVEDLADADEEEGDEAVLVLSRHRPESNNSLYQ